MERSLEVFAVIQFLILGLSHIVRRHSWVDFFTLLRERGHPGVFAHGFLSLWFGAMIIGFHNVWTGIPAVLTVVGYAYILKAFMCFLVPSSQMKTLGRVSHERSWELVLPGVVYVALGAMLSYSLWLRDTPS